MEIPKTYVKLTHPKYGYEHNKEAAKILMKDAFYEVGKISMGQSHTSVVLKNIRGVFSSVQFDFYDKDKKLIDIYNMPEYNHYVLMNNLIVEDNMGIE